MGGSVLLDDQVMDWAYWAVDPVVRALVALRVTANGMTWSALAFGVGAGVALAVGWFGLATLLATMSTIGDILDGQLARMTNSGSNRGELLDSIVDRYTEFAFLAGLAIYFHESTPYLIVVLCAVLASFMISYATAKAEALQIAAPRGLMRRHERATYLITGAGLTSLFGTSIEARWPELPPATPLLVGVGLVALIGNVSAGIRLLKISRAIP
jgi:phosphatidylglycerophosphate synthase